MKFKKKNHVGNFKYHLTASRGLKKVNCSHMLLIRCTDLYKTKHISCLMVYIQLCVNNREQITVLKKQLLLHISLKSIVKQFPSNLEFNTQQWERLFSSGGKKKSRHLPIFLGENIPANLPQNQTGTYQILHISLSMLNLNVQDRAVRKRLNKYSLFSRRKAPVD